MFELSVSIILTVHKSERLTDNGEAMKKIFESHLRFTAWASGRLLEAAAALSEEELNRDFKTADKSVVATLAHCFAADRAWFHRVDGTPRATFISPEDRTLSVLQDEWPKYWQRWLECLDKETNESLARPITFTDLKGKQHTQPLWQILLHMVNHATHHRGQVSGFLRAMGHVPPQLDLIFYYRQAG